MKINQISNKSIETLIGKIKNAKTRKQFVDALDRIMLYEFKSRKTDKDLNLNGRIVNLYLNATSTREIKLARKLFHDQYEIAFEKAENRLELVKGINIVLKSQK